MGITHVTLASDARGVEALLTSVAISLGDMAPPVRFRSLRDPANRNTPDAAWDLPIARPSQPMVRAAPEQTVEDAFLPRTRDRESKTAELGRAANRLAIWSADSRREIAPQVKMFELGKFCTKLAEIRGVPLRRYETVEALRCTRGPSVRGLCSSNRRNDW